jgi:hypothetical protein
MRPVEFAEHGRELWCPLCLQELDDPALHEVDPELEAARLSRNEVIDEVMGVPALLLDSSRSTVNSL